MYFCSYQEWHKFCFGVLRYINSIYSSLMLCHVKCAYCGIVFLMVLINVKLIIVIWNIPLNFSMKTKMFIYQFITWRYFLFNTTNYKWLINVNNISYLLFLSPHKQDHLSPQSAVLIDPYIRQFCPLSLFSLFTTSI